MRVACLCPTYRARPAALVASSIACFEAQTYPNATMIVYDDTGHFEPVRGERWYLKTDNAQFDSLPAKYNFMARGLAADFDALLVWEDDDIYLPWHVEACVEALKRGPWCHPSRVWSLYTGKPAQEGAAGRFHASLGFHRDALLAVGGWPATDRGDFDQQLIQELRRRFGDPVDPLADWRYTSPSYVFRWASTGVPHGQTFMRGPEDEEWFQRAGLQREGEGTVVVPQMDRETAAIVRELSSTRI